MKKLVILLGSLTLIAAIAYPVFAHGPGWGGGHHMMGAWRGGPGCYADYERDHGNLTPEKRSQLDDLNKKFNDDTATLRNELWTKSEELGTLLNTANPDEGKLKALQKEIIELRAKLSEKRLDYELEARKISPEGTYARGYGRGYGGHMRGYGHHRGNYGPGSCWN
jgi:zinc resistance-associated protein